MANASCVQPSPRPQPQPSRPQTQQSQQPSAPVLSTTLANVNVLPSPAPSDEPSPALSNPLDSPTPRTHPIPTTTQKQTAGQSVQYSLPHTASNPRPAHPAAATAAAAVILEESAAVSEQATTETPSEAVRFSTGMTPPISPQPNDAGQVAHGGDELGSPAVVSRPAEAQSSSDSEEGRASKRRRVQGANFRTPSDGVVITSQSQIAPSPRAAAAVLTFADLASFIDSRIDQQGGDQALQSLVERPRFYILRDACVKQDYFYLVLHQLYCLWSVNPQQISELRLGDMATISMAFEILDSVLKKNSGFARSNLEWCANFPCKPANLSRSPTVPNVAAFLLRLANNWTALHEGSFHRVCPYLMDEMISKLQCYSVVLQGILFTASRRRLDVLDGQHGTEMDRWFRKDQRDHIVDGQFRALLESDEPGELDRRNQGLIQQYHQIISAAKQQEQDHTRKQQQHNFRTQQAQAQSPQQAHFQQSVFQPISPYQQQQNQIARGSHARRNSIQTTFPTNASSQRPLPTPTIAATYRVMNSPPITQNVFNSPITGQMGHFPAALVLQSSSSGAIPSSPMAQSRQGPQTYAQGILSQPQYSFSNQHVPAENMQSAQYINPYTQNMVSMQQSAAQQQRPREVYSSTHQRMQTPRFVGSPRIVHGNNPNLRPQVPQQARANVPRVATWSHFPTTIVPRPGQVIERSDWPHSHQDKKSLMMSLHQAQARSPDRTRRADDEAERHYQAVRSFAIEPFRLVYFHEIEFTVAPEIHSLLCKMKRLPAQDGQMSLSTVREYTNSSLRYRLRCCQTNTDNSVTESDWVTKENSWPDYIFPHCNGEKLVVRRGTHHGKDLPVELTDFVVPGLNKLKVATMQAGPTADKIVRSFHLAVEVVEILSHSAVLDHVWATGVVDSAETLEKIRKRIEVVPDEDGIAVIDRSGVTASELSIDLTDPFSASIFSIPARGSACTHMECFDLETWLNTRPIKQAVKFGQQFVYTFPKRLEPSEPDKWKCPICFRDARPRSLRIDSFLLSVRRQLQEQNKLETKSILVGVDGTWRPVVEPLDDEDAGSDGDDPIPKGPMANLRKRSSKSISVERASVEIIELD